MIKTTTPSEQLLMKYLCPSSFLSLEEGKKSCTRFLTSCLMLKKEKKYNGKEKCNLMKIQKLLLNVPDSIMPLLDLSNYIQYLCCPEPTICFNNLVGTPK
jgi:hypothetical protein